MQSEDFGSRKRLRSTTIDVDIVLSVASDIINKNTSSGSRNTEERRFREMFGCSPQVVLELWTMLISTLSLEGSSEVKHLLWALLFLKLYSKETTTSRIVGGVDEKTYRKWVWIFVRAIADLEGDVIDWDKRFIGDNLDDCLVTVDGTDFRINNPMHFNKVWFSHKFNHAGLRYEVAVSIQTGNIVWIHGPFPAGGWPDINIFRHSLLSHLGVGERVEADKGYIGEAPTYVKCPGSAYSTEGEAKMQNNARARHETMNKRLKQWGCLSQQYRHSLATHGDVFRAVAVITQLSFQHDKPLYEVEYGNSNVESQIV